MLLEVTFREAADDVTIPLFRSANTPV